MYLNHLALFWAQDLQNLKHQLDDAVGFEFWVKADQFGSGCHHDPKGGVMENVHYYKVTCASLEANG